MVMYLMFLVKICLILASYSNTAANQITNAEFESPKKWLTELFFKAERNFSMELAINSKCKADFRQYMSHLRNQSVWAVRMKESSEWPSVGVFSGMTHHLGNWAECLKAKGPDGISGRYCTAEMIIKNYPITHYEPATHLDTEGCNCNECSAWSMLRKCIKNPVRADRRFIQWTICLPSSCSADDLQESLNHLIIQIFNESHVDVEIKTAPSLCSSNESEKVYPESYYRSRTIILSLFILVITSTLLDIFLMDQIVTKGWVMKILMCFSAKQNYRSLIETPEEMANPVYFAKFVLMSFVVIGHRWIFTLMFPLFQNEEMEEKYYTGGMFYLTQMNLIDAFFLIAGLLLYRTCINSIRKSGSSFIRVYAIFRLLKSLSIQGVMILFLANIFPYLGDGPLWNSAMIWMSEPCKTHWIFNLLSLNNLFTADKQCLIPAWHLSADFHISLIGIFLLFVLSKNKKLGVILTAFVFVLASILTSLGAYSRSLSGFYVLSIASIREPSSFAEYNQFYFLTYPRINSYLFGIAIGILIETLKKKNFKFPPILSIFAFLVSFAICVLVQYHGYKLALNENSYSTVWKALFAGFYRPLYLLPFAVIFLIYFVSGIGFLDFLSKRPIFFILGKLSSSVIWCGYTFQIYQMSIQRSHMPTSTLLNIHMYSVADVIISFVLGFCFYLIVDGPSNKILKLLRTSLLNRNIKRDPSNFKEKRLLGRLPHTD